MSNYVRKDFQTREKGCYLYALRRGWLDEVCCHMERQGSLFERYIYLIISREARRAYVGLTFNKEVRINRHRLSGRPVVKSLLSSPHKIVWSRLMARDDAAVLEDDLIRRLRDRGFEVVNVRKGGVSAAVPWSGPSKPVALRQGSINRAQNFIGPPPAPVPQHKKMDGTTKSAHT